MCKRSILLLFISLFFIGDCKGLLTKFRGKSSSKALAFFWPQGLTGAPSDSTALPAPNTSLTGQPTVEGLPDGLKPESITIVESKTTPVPDSINNTLVPVGKVYDIGLDPKIEFKDEQGNVLPRGENSSLVFKDPVKIIYNYNKEDLKQSGLTEELFVYYFDSISKKWLPVKSVTVDSDNGKVTAFTDHFTPFILVAAPTVTGTTTPIAPACIAADFPSGIGGSGATRFMNVDLSSMYYQDRNYKIDANSSVTVNTFNNLGFRNALGISTCNGGVGAGSGTGTDCQTNDTAAAHKFYTGTDYIKFTAHTNLDVYLVHYDDSPAAPWIASKGFVYTGMNIDTTVIGTTVHKVYKKTYLQGEVVSLDGNWRGGATTNTNYFVILKRAGDTSTGYASNLCEATPDITPPVSILNLKGIPGSDKALLQWENPINTDLTSVIIRQGSGGAPNTMGDGIAPTGSILNPNTFEITGLSPNTTYFFSAFSMDSNTKIIRTSISLTTGTDSDGDGLSDAFENAYINPGPYWYWNRIYDWNPDSDGDGVSDRDEIINGSNPTVFNYFKPSVYPYISTPNPTQYPIVTINASANADKGVVAWMVTKTATPPLGSDSRWSPTPPPFTVELIGGIGMHTYYVWAMDSSGGVNNPTPVTVNYDGQKIPRFLYETNDKANTLGAYDIDLMTGNISLLQTIPFDPSGMPNGRGPLEIAIHPNGKYVYVTDGSNLFAYIANLSNGNLTPINTVSFGNRANDPTDQLFVHPSGKFLFAFNSPSTVLRTYNINADGSVTYYTATTLSVYMYNNLLSSYNDAVFRTNFSERIEVPQDPQGLSKAPFSPINLYKNRIYVNPAGNYLEVNYLSGLSNCTGLLASTCSTSPSTHVSHLYTTDKYTIDESTGEIGSRITLNAAPEWMTDGNAFQASMNLITLPNNSYAYTNHFPSMTELSNGSYLANPGAEQSPYAVSNLNQCSTYTYLGEVKLSPRNAITYARNCKLLRSYNMSFDITRIHLEPTGHFLYVPDNDDAHNGAHVLNAFSINQNTGDLTAINTDVVGSNSVFDVKVLDLHDYNDAPVVEIEKTIQGYQNIDAVDNRIFLNGSNSYDPDAVRCGADRSKYKYSWTGWGWSPNNPSGPLTIVNANSLSGAYFKPEKTGDYRFTLSFTDDHGTCNGVNKITFKDILIKVRKIKRFPLENANPIVVTNNGHTTTITGSTIQTDPGRPVDAWGSQLIAWNMTGTSGGEKIEYGFLRREGINCDWTIPVCIPWPVCQVSDYSFQDAVNYCNSTGIAYLWQFWTPKNFVFTPIIQYGYWTYWSY